MAIIGATMRHARENHGLKQESAAKCIGVKQSTYSRMEAGRSQWSVVQFLQLARALDEEPARLIKIIVAGLP